MAKQIQDISEGKPQAGTRSMTTLTLTYLSFSWPVDTSHQKVVKNSKTFLPVAMVWLKFSSLILGCFLRQKNFAFTSCLFSCVHKRPGNESTDMKQAPNAFHN